jgi:hypothetical protein
MDGTPLLPKYSKRASLISKKLEYVSACRRTAEGLMETEGLMTRSSAASSATPYERRKPSFTFRHDFFLFLAPPSCPSEIRLVYRC